MSSSFSPQDFEAAVTKQINAENERDALDEEFQFVRETLNAVSWRLSLIVILYNIGRAF